MLAKSGRLASLAIIAPLLLASGSVGTGLRLQPESRLWISGTSTLRSFECGAEAFGLRVDASGDAPVAAVLRGENAIRTATLQLTATDLDCRNETMNEHMLKALKADRHPEISFDLSSYELTGGPEGPQVQLLGTLRMGGTSKDVAIAGQARDAGDGVLRFEGAYPLKMSDFDLKRPSLMLGTLKVGDEIVVHFDLLLKA
jgi:polyisoprenoid-binding protein YceI